MPELPEVERGRQIAETVAANRRIETCEAADDRIVFEGVAPQDFERAMVGRIVRAVHRRGKHLFFELDERPWPLFHFGMTGAFCVPGAAPLPLATGPKPTADAWPPRFTKVRFVFEGGGELAMTNARRLGRIRLRDDPLHEPPLSDLGFDPLIEPPTPAEFAKRLERRRGVVKSLLLDQSFAAGVGNWMADEILYQSGIAPTRRAESLTAPERSKLRTVLLRVVRRAVDVGAEKSEFPRQWLFHHRWGKADGAKTARGEPIEHTSIGGRTTAWVPSAQR